MSYFGLILTLTQRERIDLAPFLKEVASMTYRASVRF